MIVDLDKNFDVGGPWSSVRQLDAPCWETGADGWEQTHHATEDDARDTATRPDGHHDPVRRLDNPCWTATCPAGHPADLFFHHDTGLTPHYRTEDEAKQDAAKAAESCAECADA